MDQPQTLWWAYLSGGVRMDNQLSVNSLHFCTCLRNSAKIAYEFFLWHLICFVGLDY